MAVQPAIAASSSSTGLKSGPSPPMRMVPPRTFVTSKTPFDTRVIDTERPPRPVPPVSSYMSATPLLCEGSHHGDVPHRGRAADDLLHLGVDQPGFVEALRELHDHVLAEHVGTLPRQAPVLQQRARLGGDVVLAERDLALHLARKGRRYAVHGGHERLHLIGAPGHGHDVETLGLAEALAHRGLHLRG